MQKNEWEGDLPDRRAEARAVRSRMIMISPCRSDDWLFRLKRILVQSSTGIDGRHEHFENDTHEEDLHSATRKKLLFKSTRCFNQSHNSNSHTLLRSMKLKTSTKYPSARSSLTSPFCIIPMERRKRRKTKHQSFVLADSPSIKFPQLSRK